MGFISTDDAQRNDMRYADGMDMETTDTNNGREYQPYTALQGRRSVIYVRPPRMSRRQFPLVMAATIFAAIAVIVIGVVYATN